MQSKDGGCMKKSNGKRNIVITAIILTFIIFFNQIPANADVTDNLQNSIAIILGHVDDTLGTSFEQSTTNGKLNQMKKVVDTLDTSMDQMISPYVGSLTLWVDSNSGTYAGQTVTVTNAKGQNQTGQFVARNGHYEVDFPSLLKGSYTIAYPYVASSKILNLTTSVTLNGSAKRQQLFGDLQQMTMADIQAACKAGVINQLASVGDTFSGGTNYTYTIIGIDQDKPSDTNGNLLPSNSYGNVLTVMPLGAPAGKGNNQPVATNAYATPYATSYGSPTERINVSDISNAGWASSHMRSVIMASCYNKLPEATKNVIGSVQKITGTYFDGNQTTGDKVFLLSGKEVFGGSGYGSGSYCFSTEASATFQYQYFSNIATSIDSRKNITNVNIWWLRSPSCDGNPRFCYVLDGESGVGNESMEYGVLPAFCIY
jgi:hypothetical protein